MTPEADAPAVPTPKKSKTVIQMVPIKSLTVDLSLQIRGGINPKKVQAYQQIIREQELMDAVDAFYEEPISDKTKFLLADGFHRVMAYEGVGTEKIPCRLHVGTHADALRFTLKENGHHGAQLTSAEKRSACEKAVLDAEVSALTDKQISAMIGCSPTLVGLIRRGESKQETSKKRTARVTSKQDADPPAPKSEAGESRKAGDVPPTKAKILKQIQSQVDHDMVDEEEVIALFESKLGHYVFLPKDGSKITLKVVGKSGREQVKIETVIKSIAFDGITLRHETGKLKAEEE
jgi:ParB-like chromosome segregation protein Spo0J